MNHTPLSIAVPFEQNSTIDPSPFGADTQYYWNLRRDLFSRFDEGIKLDREGLYSAKPEKIALEIAQTLSGSCVLDAFCGVGGTAIGFARIKEKVITVDCNQQRLEMAKHNAKIYGVADKIQFIHGDIKDLLASRSLNFDSIFFDPPWGGVDYYKSELFNLDMFNPDGQFLINAALEYGCPFAIGCPENINVQQIYNLGLSFYVQWHTLKQQRLYPTIYFDPK
jgi:trimethylguanosine synthase